MDGRDTIDLIILTGFLGAGKTTLLNNLLEMYADGETGVLVNDFGPIAVDGGRVTRPEGENRLEIYEIKNGSIFCTCRTADFILGLQMFARMRPRRLIVETSGLAQPGAMGGLLEENHLGSSYRIDRVLCVVDSKRTWKLATTLPAVAEQIRAADIILINKIDLADETDLAHTLALVDSLNPRAVVHRTSYARVTAEIVGDDRTGGAGGALQECALPGQGPQTMVLEDGLIGKDALTAFLGRWAGSLLRVKGWYTFGDSHWWYLSDNAGEVTWEQAPLPLGQEPGIVVICGEGRIDDFSRAWREAIGGEQ